MKKCLILILMFLITGCTAAEQAASTPSASQLPTRTYTQTQIPTVTKTVTPTQSPTRTKVPTYTKYATKTEIPTNTSTATSSIPSPTIAYIGTELQNGIPIAAQNIDQIVRIAQWGKGTIINIETSEDGNKIYVGSAYGVAVYDANHPNLTPGWIPFDYPVWYQRMSLQGNLMTLESSTSCPDWVPATEYVTFDIESQRIDESSRTTDCHGNYQLNLDNNTKSIDGNFSFNSDRIFVDWEDRTHNSDEGTTRLITNNVTKETYSLNDEDEYISVTQASQPEGCDFHMFSMCGNAYHDSVFSPYYTEFSDSGKFLGIVYRVGNYYYRNNFSYLRIYDPENGELYSQIGDLDNPVETFKFIPDTEKIIVGYVSGVTEIRDLNTMSQLANRWDFHSYSENFGIAEDLGLMFIQRPGLIEIRRLSDGALRSRLDGVVFDLSSTDNTILIGGAEGEISLFDYSIGDYISRFVGHSAEIYDVTFSDDGNTFSTSGEDCTVRLWKTDSQEQMLFMDEAFGYYMGADASAMSRALVHYLIYLPGINQLLGWGSWSTVVSWDLATGDLVYSFQPPPLDYYMGMRTLDPHYPEHFYYDLETMTFMIDENVYDMQTGELIGDLETSSDYPAGCAKSDILTLDGKVLISYGYDEHDGQICLIDAEDHSLISVIEVFNARAIESDYIQWLHLSEDGTRIYVFTAHGAVMVYQVMG